MRPADLGADAMPTAERLAEFHTVENTYLSTFQTLGGLGLLIGTVGLAAVVLRNVLERRRELALLRAVGYRPARSVHARAEREPGPPRHRARRRHACARWSRSPRRRPSEARACR